VTAAGQTDVIVAGGGPAGSTLAWDLARRGVDVLLLERARFPREKVCGDFVDPRGLRVLAAMGCLDRLEAWRSPPIARTSTYVEWECHYSGPIPFYGLSDRLPPYGYAIPRERLDAAMLEAAAAAGAVVHDETSVADVRAGCAGVEVSARRGSRTARYTAKLVAGADGVNSVVARSQGIAPDDPTRTVLAQRLYAELEPAAGRTEALETEVFFDESLFPGYGWMFPAPGRRVNLGIGVLSEVRLRGASVPELLAGFIEGLRRHHPRGEGIRVCSRPIGGVVRTYGALRRNHFDGGVLVGDAGSFVDPMTGEGITRGMESSLLATPVLADALQTGEFHAGRLAAYEQAFRAYFDPSMVFLDFCALMLRNRHLTRPWLRALARGCQVAQQDSGFARTSSSFFGGLDIDPLGIIGQVWLRCIEDVLLAWPRFLSRLDPGAAQEQGTSPGHLFEWQMALSRSMLSDPAWHMRWMGDMQRHWSRMIEVARSSPGDPRAGGIPI
jgi:geranylgeranyl reductase family protein